MAVGRVSRPHGVNGEVLVEIYTDFPEHLLPETVVHAGEAHEPLTIRRCRKHKHGLLLAFDDIITLEQAGLLRGRVLYVAAADRAPLPEGEYYHYQLLGLRVMAEDGQDLGTLTEILKTGANDVYVATGADGSEILLPAIPEVVLDVDLPRRRMRVRLLPGLLEE